MEMHLGQGLMPSEVIQALWNIIQENRNISVG